MTVDLHAGLTLLCNAESAQPEHSGRSDHQKSGEIKVRFRPEADITAFETQSFV